MTVTVVEAPLGPQTGAVSGGREYVSWAPRARI